MTITYDSLASTTLSSTQSSITFSSISSSYTDLVVVVHAGGTPNNVAGLLLRFNGDTATNYSTMRWRGNGSNLATTRELNGTEINGGNYETGFPSFSNGGFIWTCHINSYANVATFKPVIARYNSYTETVGMVGQWRSSSAINSVTLVSINGNFESGSIFSIYGIKAE